MKTSNQRLSLSQNGSKIGEDINENAKIEEQYKEFLRNHQQLDEETYNIINTQGHRVKTMFLKFQKEQLNDKISQQNIEKYKGNSSFNIKDQRQLELYQNDILQQYYQNQNSLNKNQLQDLNYSQITNFNVNYEQTQLPPPLQKGYQFPAHRSNNIFKLQKQKYHAALKKRGLLSPKQEQEDKNSKKIPK